MKTIEIKCKGAIELEIDQIQPFQGDLKTLSKENYDKLRKQILELGFSEPASVWKDDKGIWRAINCHQRLRVLKEMRQSEGYVIPKIPCSIVEAKTEREAKKKVLALTSQFGEITKEGLYEFASLNDIGLDDLENYRFPEIDFGSFKDEFFDMPIEEGKTDDDAVPDIAQNELNVKLGEVYQLGNHRIMCGDATNELHIDKLMNGEQAVLWQSDPPYGINHVEVSQEKGQSKGYKKIANDELEDKALQDFIFTVIEKSKPHLKKGFAFYMWHAMKMQAYFSQAAAAAGILFHRQIIWAKPIFVFGRGHYHWSHELCLMGWLQGNEPPFYGERNQRTVWEIGRENDKIHPTQKPVEIWNAPILNHTKEGEIVYEPFAGSGSQVIACEKTSRKCYAMELEPHYCSVIIKRFEDYSGKKAVKLS